MDAWNGFAKSVGSFFALTVLWITNNAWIFPLLFVLALLFLGSSGMVWLGKKLWVRSKQRRFLFNRERAEKMKLNPQARETFVKQKLADVIGDGILELEVNGSITRDEASLWMHRLANIWSLDDLMPRQRKVLKKHLKEVRRVRDRNRKAGVENPEYDKHDIPGEKPLQKLIPNKFEEKDGNVVPFSNNSFVKAFMDRVRKAS